MGSEMYPKEQIKRIHRLMENLANRNRTISLAADYLLNFKIDLIGQETSFAGIVITPTDDSKNAILNIPYQVLNANGSHSKETARWMSKQVRKILKTNYAVAMSCNSIDQYLWVAIANSTGKIQVKSFDLHGQMMGVNTIDVVLSMIERFIFE